MRAMRAICLGLGLVLATGCAGGQVKVRAIPLSSAPGQQTPDFRLAEGRAQLLLGNVALALESFRKAARADPRNVEALAALGIAYDRMGRFDLSGRYYQQALAIAPRDPHLLATYADSLRLQGRAGEAMDVRTEIVERALPGPAGPAEAPQFQSAELTPDAAQMAVVALPPVEALPDAASEPGAAMAAQVQAPRIERLSLAEVALVTTGGPVWRAQVVRQSATSTTLRLPGARAARPAQVLRLLNAARVHRLAARTRARLQADGWNGIAIGDAPQVRASSIILYPDRQRALAERLSRRLGYPLRASASPVVTVLLGRDAAAAPLIAQGD